MSAPVSLLQLRGRARRLANMDDPGNNFWKDEHVDELINVYIGDLMDLLVDGSPPDYYSTDVSISVVPGTIAYVLPEDFRSAIQVYSQEGASDRLRPLRQITEAERLIYTAPTSTATVILRYNPAPPQLSADTDTLDGIAGWEEYVVSLAARDMLASEESDISWLDAKIMRFERRIRSMAGKRNLGQPKYITEVEYYVQRRYPYYQSIDAYQIRGNYIDLFVISPVFP